MSTRSTYMNRPLITVAQTRRMVRHAANCRVCRTRLTVIGDFWGCARCTQREGRLNHG